MTNHDFSLPLEQLITIHMPCHEARMWLQSLDVETAAEAWEECRDIDWMFWALRRVGYNAVNKLRLFGCWCLRNVPVTSEKKTWSFLSRKWQKIVIAAERFATGKLTKQELRACKQSAQVDYDAGGWLLHDCCLTVATLSAGVFDVIIHDPLVWAINTYNGNSIQDTEVKRVMCDGLRKIVGNPFAVKRKRKTKQ